MTNRITLPHNLQISGTIRPPGSKSITNRVLACAAMAAGTTSLRGVLDSEDTRWMIEGLQQLGLELHFNRSSHTLRVSGTSGQIPSQRADLFTGNSGTTIRFLTALLATANGHFQLDGVARMRQRPIGDLVKALNQLGTSAWCTNSNDCPPVQIESTGLSGGTASVRGDISSQFLSALLMAAPYAKSPVQVHVQGELVSQPYVSMTLKVMEAFGVKTINHSMQRFEIQAPACYQSREYEIEPDATAASYFFAAAAITGGVVTVDGLSRDHSLQGDVQFCGCLEQMGCQVTSAENQITVQGGDLRGLDVDMNGISDTVQTLAAVALFANGPTSIRNVGHIRHKETDRIGNLAIELRKLGARVDERNNGLQIVPGPLQSAEVRTYDDHRMAMSLALVGLRVPGVVILDPECTAKTYPDYFQDLQSLLHTN
ncbi:MAG: 3-phosphoshikimate 1-carboxyvinyltransferase [Planctomycetota bacterium]|nr:3-phosphoshikimate 1-carboxyvinyltransferase [Planctomycetota bacterium]